MSYKTIEEYFAKFPDDIETINVYFDSYYLPDLSRFYKLKSLICNHNKLTYLPPLPSTLESLNCNHNKLTCLPLLPSTLEILSCHNNQLTYLPPLPSKLEVLNCYNNQLTHLPLLPSALKKLNCYNNQILDCYIKKDDNISMSEYIVEFRTMVDYIAKLRNQIEIINKFRELFYALKYKKQLTKWLWHIREPKIKNKYHPSNLIAMLEEKEDITLDELDELLEKW